MITVHDEAGGKGNWPAPGELMPPASTSSKDALKAIVHPEPVNLDLVAVSGRHRAKMVRAAVEAIGGIKRFVNAGARVVISPNFSWARPVGMGTTTHPEIVREVILLCQEAGAKEIVCLDHTTHPTPWAFRINGAHDAIRGTSARLVNPCSPDQFVVIQDFVQGELHRRVLVWQAVPAPLLTCDTLICLPIAKHHRETGMTGAIKKMMGCIWRRKVYHRVDIHRCLAELALVLRPTLVLTDATRTLCTNGPEGPGRICEPWRVIASDDPVLADAYACGLLGIDPAKVSYLVHAERLGAGKMRTKKGRIELFKT